MEFEIVKMRDSDWPNVREIYRQGIETGIASFETELPSWKTWNEAHLSHSRFVALSEGEIVGWSAISPVSGRCVYAGVAEVSVYIGTDFRGKGIGKQLLLKLIEASEQAGLWTLEAGIFPENEASIHLHKACGFREVGYRERLGQLNDIWRDVILMERRSAAIGAE